MPTPTPIRHNEPTGRRTKDAQCTTKKPPTADTAPKSSAASPEDIAAFMGHDPAMTVKVYDHHRGDFDDVLDALADHVAGAARPDGCSGMPFPEAAV